MSENYKTLFQNVCQSERPLACWDCGFESRLGHGYLSLVSVVCCLCDGLVLPSPTECGVSEFDREASIMRRPWPTRSCWAKEKN
jgi:hypothetical protein